MSNQHKNCPVQITRKEKHQKNVPSILSVRPVSYTHLDVYKRQMLDKRRETADAGGETRTNTNGSKQ